jgi:uncharacterized damage-inducible protein DinB
MDTRIAALSDMLRLNTKLFRNCLDGLSEEQARARPSVTANNAAFVAAHLVDSRYLLLKALGVERANPLGEYVANVNRLEDMTRWPTLAEIGAAWTDVSRAIGQHLGAVTAEQLDGPPQVRLPGRSLLEAFMFMVQHDSYHVGQLALLRSQAGLPAMRYD